MKRRNFVVSLGSLAAGGATIVGSGAFTSVESERTINVETADDNEAFLKLSQRGDGFRGIEAGTPEQVKFSFPGRDERLDDRNLGLGTDSVYEFAWDADEPTDDPTKGLLRIKNQGTQSTDVYSEHETDSELEIELFDVDDPDRTTLRDDPVSLAVGESVDVGFRIRTDGAHTELFEETLTIVAVATD